MAEPQIITDVPKLPVRANDAHKGSAGRIMVLGGSRRMIGAPALAGWGAFRGGAGLVTLACPKPVQLAVAMLCSPATSLPLSCDATGVLRETCVGEFAKYAAGQDILAVGPGMGVGTEQQNLVRAALSAEKPLVLDADGLNNLATMSDWPSWRTGPLVLTPHPGEMSRLTNQSIEDIQANRQAVATAAVNEWRTAGDADAPLVLVLKGPGAIVTDGARLYINTTGNPGLATGGSGDVLTGLIAGLMHQGLDVFDAAVLGVWAHGRAGDLAAEDLTETAMTAEDLIEFIPAALKEKCQ